MHSNIHPNQTNLRSVMFKVFENAFSCSNTNSRSKTPFLQLRAFEDAFSCSNTHTDFRNFYQLSLGFCVPIKMLYSHNFERRLERPDEKKKKTKQTFERATELFSMRNLV
jgi:hypothetical protein